LDSLLKASATHLAELIRRREVSPVEVVEAHLERIQAVNPRINAVVTLTAEHARQAARRAGEALARGDELGPLGGVPFTVKDCSDVAGVRSTSGVTWRRDHVPDRDAVVVARMRAAGAILLGKTNTPDAALCHETANLIFGRTNNPHDPNRSAGGSTGGEGAIIAAGGSPLGLGSDIGGSIRLPSHFCGVAGFKPTPGRIPGDGHYLAPSGGLATLFSVGPLARRVDDLGLALGIASGDPASSDLSAIALHGQPVASYFGDGWAPVNPATRRAIENAARALAEAGMVPCQAALPGMHLVPLVWASTVVRNIGEVLHDASQDGAPRSLALETLRGFFGRRRVHQWVLWSMWMLAATGVPPQPFYGGLQCARAALREAIVSQIGPGGVLIAPVFPTAAPPHDWITDLRRLLGIVYLLMVNVSGVPTVVVRAGADPDGLPIGVQIIAAPGQDRVALAAARVVEEALGGWEGPVG
jgi:amidase